MYVRWPAITARLIRFVNIVTQGTTCRQDHVCLAWLIAIIAPMLRPAPSAPSTTPSLLLSPALPATYPALLVSAMDHVPPAPITITWTQPSASPASITVSAAPRPMCASDAIRACISMVDRHVCRV